MQTGRPHFFNKLESRNFSQTKLIHANHLKEASIKNQLKSRKYARNHPTPTLHPKELIIQSKPDIVISNGSGKLEDRPTQRYTKSTLNHYSKDSLQELPIKTKPNKRQTFKDSNALRKNLLMSSLQKLRKSKEQREKILNSFLCRSIEPSSKPPPSKLANKNHQTIDHSSLKSLDRKEENKSQGKVFVTRIKKKCVESNPHLLATIIKRKHETLNRVELYQFIKKIVDKTK